MTDRDFGRSLTRNEEMILLSILNLKSDAYLVAIVDHLSRITEKNISVTAVYLPLRRLEDRELVRSRFGEATAVRGGRRKKIYTVTPRGFELLDEYKRVSDMLWKIYDKPALPGE